MAQTLSVLEDLENRVARGEQGGGRGEGEEEGVERRAKGGEGRWMARVCLLVCWLVV